MSRTAPVALLLLLGACTASLPPDDAGARLGDERGPCYPNATCNSGLTCLSGLCVRSDSTDAGTVPMDGPDAGNCVEVDGVLECFQPTNPSVGLSQMGAGAIPLPDGGLPGAASLDVSGALVGNQGRYCQSCVPFAVRSVMGLSTIRDRSSFVDFSAADIWHIAGVDPVQGCASGSNLLSVVGAVALSTSPYVVTSDVWVYDDGYPIASLSLVPSAEELAAGGVARLANVWAVAPGNLDDIRAAIAQGWPVILGVHAFTFLGGWGNSEGVVDLPGWLDHDAGYHAVAITGYDDATGRFTFMNSWGTRWGNHGFGAFTAAFLERYSQGGLAIVSLAYAPPACHSATACTAGDTRRMDCGNCGTRTDRCNADCEWVAGDCEGSGLCAPSATETCGAGGTRTCSDTCEWGACEGQSCSGPSTQTCGHCGEQSRTCVNGRWSSWGTCSDEGSCAPGDSRSCPAGGVQTCSDSCSWGACSCSACEPGARRCDGRNVQSCSNDGCGWVTLETCTTGCNDDTTDCCGQSGQECCGLNFSTCASGLVCRNTVLPTCGGDTTATQLAYRYVDLCGSHHWQSTLGSCYPGTSPTSGDSACTSKVVNPGCASSDQTPWKRESQFHTYVADPGYGTFRQLFHCFDGSNNTYQLGTACASPGLPASLGWIAEVPSGSWNTPLYLCAWRTEQFFTLTASECTSHNGTLMGNPIGYVVP